MSHSAGLGKQPVCVDASRSRGGCEVGAVVWVLSALCLDSATESIFSATDYTWDLGHQLKGLPSSLSPSWTTQDYFNGLLHLNPSTHPELWGIGLVSVPFLGCSSKLVLYLIFHFPCCKQHPKQLERSCFFLFFFLSFFFAKGNWSETTPCTESSHGSNGGLSGSEEEMPEKVQQWHDVH